MKSLKNHLSLIIPLFAIFFAIEFYLILDRVIKQYEINLKNDYTILIVSDKNLKKDDIEKYLNISKIVEIKPDDMIKKIKEEDISLDLETLKMFLPKFYQIYLNHFPSTSELEWIKSRLKVIPGIKRVETFSKTHSKIYNLLMISKQISKIFLIIVSIISVLLILKQIKVWHFEHKERMYIMELFGAPFWMRSGVLFRLAIVDTFIATLFLIGIYYYFLNSDILKNIFSYLHILLNFEEIIKDCLILGGIGLIITFFSVLVVSTRQIQE
ncbi:FtsX-like permease family protein [Nitrosophilus kaiyonis]|uniref:FtsX-like permease family protein n=1 Tax=Nitrosophilus kaiyonis TaxID=2930200 RepID=UPI002491314B|nr:FtsX-like permease family protein [Nitrosophilus kaiyonis]